MIELEVGNKVIAKIIDEDKDFRMATKEVFLAIKIEKPTANSVKSLVGCVFRHIYLFNYIIKGFEFELSENQKRDIYLVFANRFFIKKLDLKKCDSYLKKSLGEDYFKLIESRFYGLNSLFDYVNLPTNSDEYCSIRFNCPKWLIKMWDKYYSTGIRFKILKRNLKPRKYFYRVNELKPEKFDVDVRYFEKCDVDKFYLLKERESFNNEQIANHELVHSNPALEKIIDAYKNDFVQEVSIYMDTDIALFKNLAIKSNRKLGINAIAGNLDECYEATKFVRVNNLKNVNLFGGNDEFGFRTGLSHKQELFFVNPKSSGFDKIRENPDFFVHFKREQLDDIINHEYNVLELCSKFIIPGGVLVYLVPTLSLKESTILVHRFLNANPAFELIEEKTHFAHEEDDCAYYCAAIRLKEEEQHD